MLGTHQRNPAHTLFCQLGLSRGISKHTGCVWQESLNALRGPFCFKACSIFSASGLSTELPPSLVWKRGPGQPAAGDRQPWFEETLGEAREAQTPFHTQAICLWFHPPKNSSLPQAADSSRVGGSFFNSYFSASELPQSIEIGTLL